jgi:hypothetical protein
MSLSPSRLRASSSPADDSLHVVTEARLSAGVLTWEAHERWEDFARDEAHKEWEDEREAVGMRALRAHLGCEPSQAKAEAVTSFAKAGPDFGIGLYEHDEGPWQALTADERETAADHARTLDECGALKPVLDAIGREGALLAQVGEEPDDYVYPDDYAGTQALMEAARDHARSREVYRQVPAPAVRVRSLCPSRRLDRRLSGGRPSRRRATRATAASSRGDPDLPDLAGPSPRFSRPWRPAVDARLAELLAALDRLPPLDDGSA